MKYFLFHAPAISEGFDPDFLGHFGSLPAVRQFIKKDLEVLRKEYPDTEFVEKDYLIAVRHTTKQPPQLLSPVRGKRRRPSGRLYGIR